MRRQALLLVERISGHADRDADESDHHQISERPYSATGIGRGNRRSPSAPLAGRLTCRLPLSSSRATNPIRGPCMIPRYEGRQGWWRLGGVS